MRLIQALRNLLRRSRPTQLQQDATPTLVRKSQRALIKYTYRLLPGMDVVDSIEATLYSTQVLLHNAEYPYEAGSDSRCYFTVGSDREGYRICHYLPQANASRSVLVATVHAGRSWYLASRVAQILNENFNHSAMVLMENYRLEAYGLVEFKVSISPKYRIPPHKRTLYRFDAEGQLHIPDSIYPEKKRG